jgi:hypothetical protein
LVFVVFRKIVLFFRKISSYAGECGELAKEIIIQQRT